MKVYATYWCHFPPKSTHLYTMGWFEAIFYSVMLGSMDIIDHTSTIVTSCNSVVVTLVSCLQLATQSSVWVSLCGVWQTGTQTGSYSVMCSTNSAPTAVSHSARSSASTNTTAFLFHQRRADRGQIDLNILLTLMTFKLLSCVMINFYVLYLYFCLEWYWKLFFWLS